MSASAYDSENPDPDVQLAYFVSIPVLTAQITPSVPSRIMATASGTVKVDKTDEVFCSLTIDNTPMGQTAVVSGWSPTAPQILNISASGAAVMPAGAHFVQLRCQSGGASGFDTFNAGDLNVVAAAQ
jgi:hypothetical protein